MESLSSIASGTPPSTKVRGAIVAFSACTPFTIAANETHLSNVNNIRDKKKAGTIATSTVKSSIQSRKFRHATKKTYKEAASRRSSEIAHDQALAAATSVAQSLGGRGIGIRQRFVDPVPEPLPFEVLKPRRGRDSSRRIREAEHFRQYMYLRRLLKPWSEQFRERFGRTPSLVDVHDAAIPGLLDRFVEYLDAVDGLRNY